MFPVGTRRTQLSATFSLVVILVTSALPEFKGSPLLYLVVGPAVALATAPLISVCGHWQRLPATWLASLKWLGTISYAAYLWNWPLVLWLGNQPLPALHAFAAVILTIAAAAASWWVVERPALQLKTVLDRPKVRSAELKQAPS